MNPFIESIAKQLDGIEYPLDRHIPKRLVDLARENGLTIAYGQSDDLLEFIGAIDDEVGAYNGGSAHGVEAAWGEDGAAWTLRTGYPHATFRIMEDGEVFCIAVVFEPSKPEDPREAYRDACVKYFEAMQEGGIARTAEACRRALDLRRALQ